MRFELLQSDRWPARYGLALVVFLGVLVLRLLLIPPSFGFILISFLPAVLCTFYLCGVGPGILVAFASAAVGYVHYTPASWAVDVTQQAQQATAMFLGTSVVVGWLVHRLHRTARSRSRAVADLTLARQHHEKLLREQSEILNTDLVGMAIVRDLDRSVRWANNAFCTIYGLAPGSLNDQPSRMLFPDEASYVELGEASRRVLAHGKTYRTQLEIIHRDARRVWVDVSGARLAPDRNESIWMMLDITHHKLAEVNRLRAVELEAENRQVLEASRLKGMFLANMSHELRTPLNAIIGLTHLLQSGSVEPGSTRHAHYLENIQASGQHLLGLINATLDLTRIESGRLSFNVERIDLLPVVTDLTAMVQRSAEARQIRLHASVAPGMGPVWTDPLRLRQAVLNYLSNAIKFSSDGGAVSVRVSAAPDGHFRHKIGALRQAPDINRVAFGICVPDTHRDIACHRALVADHGAPVDDQACIHPRFPAVFYGD